jgi:hypothetical protein
MNTTFYFLIKRSLSFKNKVKCVILLFLSFLNRNL